MTERITWVCEYCGAEQQQPAKHILGEPIKAWHRVMTTIGNDDYSHEMVSHYCSIECHRAVTEEWLASLDKNEAQSGNAVHPMQPVVLTDNGTARFKENKIVNYLLEAGTFDLNHLAVTPFDQEDRIQFAQLIGYSVCGFGDLSYVTDDAYDKASAAAEVLVEGAVDAREQVIAAADEEPDS